MLSNSHEILVQMFRDRPSLATDLLTDPLGIRLPSCEGVQLDSAELTDVAPTEYRADAVVTLRADEKAVLAVVVEVQLGRDDAKRWSWPVYLATVRARKRCPAVLLVVCTGLAIARWCATPIELGHPGWALVPLVVGPDRVPVITDAEHARAAPQLVVLSALAHGGDPDSGEKVLHALTAGLATIHPNDAMMYVDVVSKALPAAAQRHLEEMMNIETYEFQSDFARRLINQGRTEGRTEGEATGEAKAVLAVLAARGVEVPADARGRISDCTDLDQLDGWVRRAATADSVRDLFDQPLDLT